MSAERTKSSPQLLRKVSTSGSPKVMQRNPSAVAMKSASSPTGKGYASPTTSGGDEKGRSPPQSEEERDDSPSKNNADAAKEKAKFIFTTKLPLQIKPNYFAASLPEGEEERVCHDMVKCCAEMESQVGWDNLTIETHNNAKFQKMHQTLFGKLGDNPKMWTDIRQSIPEELLGTMLLAAETALLRARAPAGIKLATTIKLTSIGTSFLFPERAWMVHIWTNPKCASNFISLWSRVWQTIFQHRIEGMACPFSSLLIHKGSFITITILPPVVMKKTPPINLPVLDGPKSLASYMALQLTVALGLREGSTIPFFYGCDSRYYMLGLGELLSARFQLPAPYSNTFLRHELLDQCFTSQGLDSSATGQPAAQYPPSDEEVLTLIRTRQIPLFLKAVVAKIQAVKRKELRMAQPIFDSMVIPRTMHECGINVCFLYEVLVAAEKLYAAEKEKWGAEQLEPLQLVIIVCKIEMVSRTVKKFARFDVQQQISAGLHEDEDLLDAINRCAKLATSANAPTFFKEHLLPALRKKFGTPNDFIIVPKDAQAMMGLRAVSSSFAAVFDQVQQKFVKFAPSPSYSISFLQKSPPADLEVAAASNWTPQVRAQYCETFWAKCDAAKAAAADSTSAMRCRLLMVRGISNYLMHRVFPDMLSTLWEQALVEDESQPLVKGAEEWDAQERVRLAGLLCEYYCQRKADRRGSLSKEELSDIDDVLEQQLHLMRDAATIPLDQPLVTVMILRVGIARHYCGLPSRPDLWDEALLDIPESARKWIQFFLADIYMDGLAELEKQIVDMDYELVSKFHDVVQRISKRFQETRHPVQAFRYEQRVIQATLTAKVAARHVDTHKLAVSNHAIHRERYGERDFRTCIGAYAVGILCLAANEETKMQFHLLDLVNRLVDAATLSEAAAADVVRDWQSLELVLKTIDLLETHRRVEVEAAGLQWLEEQNAPESFTKTALGVLRGHLNVFGDWYLALRVIEKAGRGFFVRKDLGRAYSIWLQEQKDIRAMEEAKREKIERLRAAIRRRLVDFFVARRIPMSDENIDTMVEEALAAESVEQYFAWLREKYGEIPNGLEESAIGREETELQDIIVTPRAAQAIKDAEFSYESIVVAPTPGADELFEAFMADERLVEPVRKLFQLCDTDRDGRVTPTDCYALFEKLAIMDKSDLDRIFLKGPFAVASSLSFEEFARHVMDTQTMQPPL